MKIYKYGLIGEKLGHSFSKEIHSMIQAIVDKEVCSQLPSAYGKYGIMEIAPEKVKPVMMWRRFKAINVTIPYKETVIPYLSKISDEAKEIGSVNTIVRKGFRLYGYNTDFFGMKMLIERMGVSIEGRKVAVLGSGGTSKTANAVMKSMKAREILTVSRNASNGRIGYNDLYINHRDVDIIINTTPIGMYPNVDACPVELKKFDGLSAVIDAVYNPLRTNLVIEAEELGIPAAGGLYMLVAQAVSAAKKFFNIEIDIDTIEKIYKKIEEKKQNIVLIGMPSCGKSTVANEIKKALELPVIDTDDLVASEAGKSIPEIFNQDGEEAFRDIESAVIDKCSLQNGVVIATGGGSILRKENIIRLKRNGKIYFIDRPLNDLCPTSDRPLSSDKSAIEKRYSERYDIYKSSSDVIVPVTDAAREVARDIISDFKRRKHYD